MAGTGVTRLAWVAAAVVGVHGYFYLTTQEIHPCAAAAQRLDAEYGMATATLKLGAVLPVDLCDGAPPQVREILGKEATIEKLGVLGCYWPAVLGWRSVPQTQACEVKEPRRTR